MGVAMKTKVKLLGIDYGAGKRVVRAVQAVRMKAVTGRLQRIKRMGKRAAQHLVRTGAAPAMKYGVAVCGATDSTVNAARRFSCAAVGEMRGRSAFARLALAKYDVGTQMAIEPVVEWARAVWDGLVSREELKLAWRRAVVDVGTASRPFQAVRGPAGAMVASALRLGWTVPSPFDFIDGAGERISLDGVCPAVVALMAKDDLSRAEAVASTFAARIGGPPDLEPLSDLLASKVIANRGVAGSLRALGEGGWWTQSRMHQVGMSGVVDGTCRACVGAEGTLYHRCVGCPATADKRND
jgi:hypothetical protein